MSDHREKFREEIKRKQKKRQKAEKEKYRSMWFGLGMFGVVGWLVMIPVIIFTAIGIWIDSAYPGPVSWTLILMFTGLILGLLNAWIWIKKQRETIEKERENE